MTDIESLLLNDIPYLTALETSETAAKSSYKNFLLPDISVHCIVAYYLKDHGQLTFKSIYQDLIGQHYLSQFCGSSYEILQFLKEIDKYEDTRMHHKREEMSRDMVNLYLMPDLLANESLFPKEVTDRIIRKLNSRDSSPTLFHDIKRHLIVLLEGSKFKEFLKSPEFARYCQWKHIELNIPLSMSTNDFTLLRIVGRGGFGEVHGCRKKDTGKLFAIKCLDKRRLKLMKGETLAINERDILSRLSSSFTVNMHYCFHSANTVCLVLDLMNGGDLQFHLDKRSMFTEDAARFYMCEVILGLEHLHDNHIVHRDIKPSNTLLDMSGHVRISDFGLACNYLVQKPSQKVGTNGFMAPEVVRKEYYTFTGDWYSFGCLCYRLVNNDIPSKASPSSDKPPEHLSTGIIELLKGLLKADPNQRLGCYGRGANELKECSFFKGIDWDDVADKKLRPPIIPSKSQVNAAGVSTLDTFTDDHIKEIKLTEEESAQYKDFSRVIGNHWQTEILSSLFDKVNILHDKREAKERQKLKTEDREFYSPALVKSDCILQGHGQKLSTTMGVQHWQRKYFILYSNRLEWADSYMQLRKFADTVMPFDGPLLIREVQVKESKVVVMQKIGERLEYQLKFDSAIDHMVWFKLLRETSLTTSTLSLSGFNSNFVAPTRRYKELLQATNKFTASL